MVDSQLKGWRKKTHLTKPKKFPAGDVDVVES